MRHTGDPNGSSFKLYHPFNISCSSKTPLLQGPFAIQVRSVCEGQDVRGDPNEALKTKRAVDRRALATLPYKAENNREQYTVFNYEIEMKTLNHY